MTFTIHKYRLPIVTNAPVQVMMPDGNVDILTVRIQHGQPTIWARVVDDPGVGKVTHRFRWVPTGRDATYVGEYVGTLQIQDETFGELVWHLFHERFGE